MTARDAQPTAHERDALAAVTEVVFDTLIAHQRIPMYHIPSAQRCVGCDNLKGQSDGSNSPRHTHHLAEHVAAVVLARLADHGATGGQAAVIAAIEALYPPYNYELRYDGTEDPTAAAYVEAFREVDAALEPFRAAVSGGGDGKRDGGAP